MGAKLDILSERWLIIANYRLFA
jgi:hypothetical protein